MPKTSARLTLIPIALMLCLSLFVPPALADDADEQAKYDEAMELINKWDGRGDNHEQAFKIGREMLQANPKSARAYTVMGRATWWMGYINDDTHDQAKLSEAQGYYRKAVELDPSFRDAEYYLGVSLVTAKEYGQALIISDKLQKAYPDWPRSYMLPLLVSEKTNDNATILKQCEELISKFPDDKNAVRSAEKKLVDVYAELGQLDKAEALHLKFIADTPVHAWTLGNYAAFLCDHKEDYDKAIEYAQKALAIMDYKGGRSILADSAFNKSRELLRQNKLEEAETYCLMAVENESTFTQAWAELALINSILAKQNNDLERMKKAQYAAHKAQQLGMTDEKWAKIMMLIAFDLNEMEKQAKQKPETQN